MIVGLKFPTKTYSHIQIDGKDWIPTNSTVIYFSILGTLNESFVFHLVSNRELYFINGDFIWGMF